MILILILMMIIMIIVMIMIATTMMMIKIVIMIITTTITIKNDNNILSISIKTIDFVFSVVCVFSQSPHFCWSFSIFMWCLSCRAYSITYAFCCQHIAVIAQQDPRLVRVSWDAGLRCAVSPHINMAARKRVVDGHIIYMSWCLHHLQSFLYHQIPP